MINLIEEKYFLLSLNNLFNPVDKFLVASIYYGLQGTIIANDQILSIKKSDVNLEKGTINLMDGRVYKMNDAMKKITQEALSQTTYIKIGKNNQSNEDYLFNPNSDYVIRTKPTVRNNNGLNKLSKEGVKTRINAIRSILGSEYNSNNLKLSGVYNLLLQEPQRTINDADAFLRKNGFGIRRSTLAVIIKEINGNL